MKDYQKALDNIKKEETFFEEEGWGVQHTVGSDLPDCISLMQKLVDKEMPIVPICEQDEDDGGNPMEPWFRCPKCGIYIEGYDMHNQGSHPDYCIYCGQHLDWSSEIKRQKEAK